MQCVDLDEFLEMPVGRFHWSLPLVLWAWSPSLVGIAHIGAITSADLPLLRRGAELPFHRALARPYRAIIDASRLTHLDPDVFAFLVEHLQAVRAEGSALIRTLCIVRPPGLH